MKLWAQYIAERETVQILHNDKGFITHYGFKKIEKLTDGSMIYYRREF